MSFFTEIEKSIEREFRRFTEKVFGPAQSDELLLVHRAILADVESKIQTMQRGRRIFPFNHLTVRLASPDEARRALFRAAFEQDGRLAAEIRECLAAAGCDVPAGFTVDIETAEAGPKGFEVFYEIVDQPAPARTSAQPARLVVVSGKANGQTFLIQKPRTNIGRLNELTDSRQTVVRRNDVVFEEGAGEPNPTVSRAHAHIRYDTRAGEYRISDDGSEFGTRIFRDGRSIPVPPGGARGECLRAGDEIYIGRACLRFEQPDTTGLK